jgi:hypothetical protein
MPKLFSYGTLQQEDVQLATFGRRLTGVSDALVGYRQSMVAIQDPEVVRTSGKTHHPIVAFTPRASRRGSMSTPAASRRRREPWTRATRSQPIPSRVMPANAGIQSVTDET